MRYYRWASLMLVLLLLFLFAGTGCAEPLGTIDSLFPDPVVANTIADLIGKHVSDSVTQEELDKIDSLHISDNLGSWEGIEYLQNLKSIELRDSDNSDGSFTCTFNSDLLKLYNLQQIVLDGANIAGDLTVMEQMQNLQFVQLVNVSYILPQITFESDEVTVKAPMLTDKMAVVPNLSGAVNTPFLDPNKDRSITWTPPSRCTEGVNGIYGTHPGRVDTTGGTFELKLNNDNFVYNIRLVQPFTMPRVWFIADDSVQANPRTGNGCITDLTEGCKYTVTVFKGQDIDSYIVNADGTLGAKYTGSEKYVDLPALSGTSIVGLENFTEHMISQIMPDAEEENTGSIVEDENQLPSGSGGMPAIVLGRIDQGSKEVDVILLAEPLPVQEENSMAFEIELVYENGEPFKLNGGTKLYLPFPPGMTIEDCRRMNFTIRHDAHDGVFWYSTQDSTIKVTPHGLMVSIDSLSPFVISWETAPAYESLPQTGDSSSLLLYAGLLAASFLCLLVQLRRRHA